MKLELLPFPARQRASGSIVTRLALALLAAALLALMASAAPAHAVISGQFGYQRRATPTVVVSPLQYHGGPVLHSSDPYAIYWDPDEAYRGDWQQMIDEYLQAVGAESGSDSTVFGFDQEYLDSGGHALNQSTFRGGYVDKDPYPTSENCTDAHVLACLTDQQIRTELKRLIASGALPGATGPPVYYVLTPPGVTVCTDGGGSGNCSDSTATPANGVCGYHSAIEPGGANQVIYAVQPWVAGDAGEHILNEEPLETSGTEESVLACQDDKHLQEPNQLAGLNPFGNYSHGLADVIINDLSIEQRNVAVDPLLNGWYQTSTGDEQGDLCKWQFGVESEEGGEPTHAGSASNATVGVHSYYIQWAFNSTAITRGKGITCAPGVSLVPHFTAPNPVNTGDVVAFDGLESDISLWARTAGLPADEPYVAPVFTWDFGDGTGVSGTEDGSVFHTYTYGGSYVVTLTVTDGGGDQGSYRETITVNGPAKPAPSEPPASGPNSQPSPKTASSTDSGSSSSSSSPTGKPPAVGPAATQSVISRSLSQSLKKGLVVRYSVNQRAAGHFEVLLPASIAHRIGLHGSPATGLPAGTPAQLVIAKAILVTTKAGGSTMKIQFGKVTAARLHKLHNVSLMLRLVVRSPTGGVTTVLSKVSLSG